MTMETARPVGHHDRSNGLHHRRAAVRDRDDDGIRRRPIEPPNGSKEPESGSVILRAWPNAELHRDFRACFPQRDLFFPVRLTSAMTRTSEGAKRRSRSVAVDRAVMWHSKLIPRNVERTVEDAENIDVSVVPHEVGDSVMPIE